MIPSVVLLKPLPVLFCGHDEIHNAMNGVGFDISLDNWRMHMHQQFKSDGK